MKKTYCVYKHTAPNGKVYIGITRRSVEERWQGGKGYKYNKHFTNAIKKYGWNNIDHEIISDKLSEKEAKEMEHFFVLLYKSYDSNYGYNKTLGGDDLTISVEKKVLQYSVDGKFLKKYSSLTEAAVKTKTNISRISDCANGKRFTTNGFIWLFEDDELKYEKLNDKIREKKHPSAMCGGSNHQARSIEQYSLDGLYIKTYPSAQDAADELGIDYSAIKSSASRRKNNHFTSGGYIWIHSDEVDKYEILHEIIDAYKKSGCEKAVCQYSLNGEFIREYSSITEAKKNFSKKSGHIGSACNGKRNTAYGYKWKFKESQT